MRTLPLLLASLSLAACVTVENDPPPGENSRPDAGDNVSPDAGDNDLPDGGGNNGPDASPDAGTKPVINGITGKVCITEDWRPPLACAALPTGTTVTLSIATAGVAGVATDGNGYFKIDAQPTYSTLTILASAPGFVSGAVVAYLDDDGNAEDILIPLTTTKAFSAIQAGSNRTVTAGRGVAVVYAREGDAQLITLFDTLADGSPPYYSTVDANVWVQAPIDEWRGAVGYFDVAPKPAIAGRLVIDEKIHDFTVPVIADAVTFHTLAF